MHWRLLLLIVCLLPAGCRKLLDIDAPGDRVTNTSAFASNVSAAGVLTGLYYDMSAGGAFMGDHGISYLCALSADEFILQQEDELPLSMYRNEVLTTNVPFWRVMYQYIYRANGAIEGLTASIRLTPAIRQQLLGEAKFIRAFCYFYLVNLFGEVPLVTSTDYKVSAAMYRTPVHQVYSQIVYDLQDAQQLLREEYLLPDIVSVTTERVRPNRTAATALLARVYLYLENWPAAIAAATTVIDNRAVYDTVSLQQVFLKNSKEAIWQLHPVDKVFTDDAILFLRQRPVQLSKTLIQAFEQDDLRRRQWLNSASPAVPGKYQYTSETGPAREYLVVLRLAEQYLIRAEARLQTGDIDGAKDDLTVIRMRAGLSAVHAGSTRVLMKAVQQERRVELFAEWGHRWLDLKRWHATDEIMPAAAMAKGGSWHSYKGLYPVPHSEMLLNGHLSQNEGYPD